MNVKGSRKSTNNCDNFLNESIEGFQMPNKMRNPHTIFTDSNEMHMYGDPLPHSGSETIPIFKEPKYSATQKI